MKRNSLFVFILIALIATTAGYFLWQKLYSQAAIDQKKIEGYLPSYEINQLVDRLQLTELGKTIFFVNYPQIVAQKDELEKKCGGSGHVDTLKLGCYFTNDQGIFLLAVQDDRQDDVLISSAIHEILHAAFNRLPPNLKAITLDQLRRYSLGENKEAVSRLMEPYKNVPEQDRLEELHSFAATEFLDLPLELESYYERYFKARRKSVEKYLEYKMNLTSHRQTLVKQSSELYTQKMQIEQWQKEYQNLVKVLHKQKSQFPNLQKTLSRASFNKILVRYNTKVTRAQQLEQKIKSLIESYNKLLKDQKAHNSEEKELSNIIKKSN